MSAWGAFARGVGGQGALSLAQSMDHRSELAAAMAQRDKEREDQQQWKGDQYEQNRLVREEIAAMRAGGGSGSGSGGRGGALTAIDPREDAISRLSQSEGISRPEASALIDRGYLGGQNDITKDVITNDSDLSGTDRRLNAGISREKVPDVEKFKALMGKIGGYYADAHARDKSNIQQVAAGEQTRFETEAGQAAIANPSRAPVMGAGVAVSKGQGQFDGEGDNKFSGAPGALTVAKTNAERALAADRYAGAGQHKAAADKLIAEASGDIRKANPESLSRSLDAIKNLINTYDKNSLDAADVEARKALQVTATRLANELSRRGLGDAPVATPTQADARKADPLRYNAAPKDVASRTVGVIYETPRGPMKWMGNGWSRGI